MNIETLPRRYEAPNIVGDRLNVLLLTFLYIFESIPRVMSEAISLILQNRNVSYTDQAEFSLVLYANFFKLLWAPIVDGLYSKKFGRRKIWVIPLQFSIGVYFLFISMNVDDWLGSEEAGSQKPKTRILTVTFFLCGFLSSIRDVAVDGWALTMLKKRNVGHASTSNNNGWVLAQFLGYVLFLLSSSKTFCNKFRSVPEDHGFVSFSGFICIWAAVYIISAVFLIFKKETCAGRDDKECRLGLKKSYRRLWAIIKIKPIQQICIILLTFEVGSSPLNGVVPLKLIDAGVRSDTLALWTVPSIPFELLAPFVLSRFLIGNRAMRTFIICYTLKLLTSVTFAMFLYSTPYLRDMNDQLPAWHYWLMAFIYNTNILNEYLMYVAVWAFLSRISDSRFGGMYTALFCALSSIGLRWPISVCLWLVNVLTIQSCGVDEIKNVRTCSMVVDGYFIETILLTIVGIIWLWWARKRIYALEDLETSAWIVK